MAKKTIESKDSKKAVEPKKLKLKTPPPQEEMEEIESHEEYSESFGATDEEFGDISKAFENTETKFDDSEGNFKFTIKKIILPKLENFRGAGFDFTEECQPALISFTHNPIQLKSLLKDGSKDPEYGWGHKDSVYFHNWKDKSQAGFDPAHPKFDVETPCLREGCKLCGHPTIKKANQKFFAGVVHWNPMFVKDKQLIIRKPSLNYILRGQPQIEELEALQDKVGSLMGKVFIVTTTGEGFSTKLVFEDYTAEVQEMDSPEEGVSLYDYWYSSKTAKEITWKRDKFKPEKVITIRGETQKVPNRVVSGKETFRLIDFDREISGVKQDGSSYTSKYIMQPDGWLDPANGSKLSTMEAFTRIKNIKLDLADPTHARNWFIIWLSNFAGSAYNIDPSIVYVAPKKNSSAK